MKHHPAQIFIDDETGFTLIELLLYVSLSGVILTGVYLSFTKSTAMYADVLRSSVVVQNTQMAADILEREAKNIKSKTSVIIATSNEFKFTSSSNAVVDLVYSTQQIRRNAEVLAGGVTSFVFTYHKWDGTTWTSCSPTSQIAKIRYVFVVTYQGYTYSKEKTVLLRNMR